MSLLRARVTDSQGNVATDDKDVMVGIGGPLASDGFESGDLGYSANGFAWGDSTLVSVTQRNPRTGSHSLDFYYEAGADGEDAWAEQRFSHPPLTEVWYEWWIYVPDGSEPWSGKYWQRPQVSTTNNKFFLAWGGDYSDPDAAYAALEIDEQNGDDGYLSIGGRESSSGIGWHTLPGTNEWWGMLSSVRGKWTRIRVHIKLAAVGGTDGVIEIWADDVKVSDNQGLSLAATAPDGAPNYLNNGYFWGWCNSGFDEDVRVFVDDVKVYDQNPGW